MNHSELLNLIQQLANKGHSPSVALIKGNIPGSMPLPSIIKGLNDWKKLTQSGKKPLTISNEAVRPDVEASKEKLSLQQQIDALKQEMLSLKQEVADLKAGK